MYFYILSSIFYTNRFLIPCIFIFPVSISSILIKQPHLLTHPLHSTLSELPLYILYSSDNLVVFHKVLVAFVNLLDAVNMFTLFNLIILFYQLSLHQLLGSSWDFTIARYQHLIIINTSILLKLSRWFKLYCLEHITLMFSLIYKHLICTTHFFFVKFLNC